MPQNALLFVIIDLALSAIRLMPTQDNLPSVGIDRSYEARNG
jgi:hypothetical protein